MKIGEHELNAETLMLGYGYDPRFLGRVGQATGASDLHLRLPNGRTGSWVSLTIWLDAARLRSTGKPASFILASITRTWKSSRIGSRSTKKPQAGWCLPPAWRPSSL